MGRELKRRQAKMTGKVVKNDEIKKNEGPYDDIYKLLKTFGLILLIVLAIHFFTALLITKEIEWFSKDEVKEEVTIANTILAKNTFNQSEEEYYVYFYDYDEEDSAVTNLINGMLSDSKVYKVNTSDGFNSNFVTEDEFGNSGATSVDDLKVISPTLIKISGDSIVEYYETTDVIKDFLEEK